MGSITLYSHPFSNNAMRVQIALEEKGLDYDYQSVDLFAGAHKKDEYLEVNPRGQVPCLRDVDGDLDLVIFESAAIVDYLDRRYPEPPLVPTEPAAMARCVRLMAEFHQKLDPKNIFGSVRFRGLGREELGDRVDALLAECKRWEAYAAESGPFLVGKAFTAADILVFPFFALILDGLGLPSAHYPALHAWYGRVKARPSVAAQPFWRAAAREIENPDLKILAEG